MNIQDAAKDLCKKLSSEGRLVEGGWRAYCLLSLNSCSELQKSEMRKAFYFGAQHVFASILSILDPGEEPTEKDMETVTNVHAELKKFVEEMEAQHNQ